MTLRLNVSRLAPASHLVRVLDDDGVSYSRMICVTELDGGETLFLAGWIGTPLTPRQWREGRDQLFPRARRICFDRREPGTGAIRRVTLELASGQ
jgi:hypothetical protein